MSKTAIQLVCFDIGGVLVKIVDSWQHACSRLGLPDDPRLHLPAAQKRLVQSSHAFETGHLAGDQFCTDIARESGYSCVQARSVIEAWLIEMYPGVAEMIDRIHAAGVRTALLSNTNPVHWKDLLDPEGAYAPLSRVQHRFASHLIRSRKPEPAAYEHVERATGVEARRILFFDDLESNINAAMFQLWNAVLINPKLDTVQQIERHLRHHRIL
jgi:HAD superfamily hydrolase (TIGR01509 family)